MKSRCSHSKEIEVLPWDELPPLFQQRHEKDSYISMAIWPKGKDICLGNTMNASTDGHNDFELAQAICKGLRRCGFGGDGEIFPEAVRVYKGKHIA